MIYDLAIVYHQIPLLVTNQKVVILPQLKDLLVGEVYQHQAQTHPILLALRPTLNRHME